MLRAICYVLLVVLLQMKRQRWDPNHGLPSGVASAVAEVAQLAARGAGSAALASAGLKSAFAAFGREEPVRAGAESSREQAQAKSMASGSTGGAEGAMEDRDTPMPQQLEAGTEQAAPAPGDGVAQAAAGDAGGAGSGAGDASTGQAPQAQQQAGQPAPQLPQSLVPVHSSGGDAGQAGSGGVQSGAVQKHTRCMESHEQLAAVLIADCSGTHMYHTQGGRMWQTVTIGRLRA